MARNGFLSTGGVITKIANWQRDTDNMELEEGTLLSHAVHGLPRNFEPAVQSSAKKINAKLERMKIKSDILRESIAEFIATFLLVLLGNALLAALLFSGANEVASAAAPLGWGLALLVAIAVTGGVSGCHANPAVTLAFATVGKLSWKKVLPYFFAQYAGAFVSSIFVYLVYFDSFRNVDSGVREIPPSETATAQIFATYIPAHVSIVGALADTIVSTMVLMMVIVAIIDPNNMQIPKGSYPVVIGLSLAAVIYAFPYNCGAPLNPARDFAPRIFTAIAGWGKAVFSFRDYGYFWIPIVGPHIGAIIGAWIYKMGIELHWPVDSYDFESPTEVKTKGEFKKKEDLASDKP